MLRLLDLFSGIGGFSCAAEQIVGSFRTVQFVERDPFCQRVLQQHWPDVPIHDDIRTFHPTKGSADVVAGGFPCQDISHAGRGAGIKEGTRSGLFYEVIRIVRLVRPRYVVLENVAAILANGLDTVLGELAEAGFDAEWACIPAADLGACHRRDRWWLVAYPNSLSLQRSRTTGQCLKHSPGGKKGAVWSDQGIPRLNPEWRSYLSEPVLCRGDAGLRDRVDRLKALGNTVVPQVASVPLRRVLELHQQYLAASTPVAGDDGPVRLLQMLQCRTSPQRRRIPAAPAQP